jgi:hypothetical protein
MARVPGRAQVDCVQALPPTWNFMPMKRTESALGCWVPGDNQADCGDLEWPELREQLSAYADAAPVGLVVTGPLGGVLRG